jgi:hypothetical protein
MIQPILYIKVENEETIWVPVNTVKQAKEIALEQYNPDKIQSFIYSTINDSTKIENTITIRP